MDRKSNRIQKMLKRTKSKRYRVRRSSGDDEYLTPGQLRKINKQKAHDRQRVMIGGKRFALLIDLLIFGVAAVLILFIIGYVTRYAPVTDETSNETTSQTMESATSTGTTIATSQQTQPTQTSVAGQNQSQTLSELIAKDMNQDLTPETTQGANQPPTLSTTSTVSNSQSSTFQGATGSTGISTQAGANQDVSNNAQIRAEVRETIENWAAAWARQDVDGYINTYSPNYTPSPDLTHKEWLRRRIERLITPQQIDITLSNINIIPQAADISIATFTQSYRSPNYQDLTDKTITLRKLGDSWFIVNEASQPRQQ